MNGFTKLTMTFKCNHMNKYLSYGNLYYLQCNKKIDILILYVDDIFLTRNDHEKITWLEQDLHSKFKMTFLGFAQNTLTSNFLITRMAYCYIKLNMIKTLLKNLAWLIVIHWRFHYHKISSFKGHEISSCWHTFISMHGWKIGFSHQHPLGHNIHNQFYIEVYNTIPIGSSTSHQINHQLH